jgi:hypothetical protein
VKRDWKKKAASAAKHARLMARKPGLREALYGRELEERGASIFEQARLREAGLSSEQLFPPSRETAQKET